MSRRFLGSSFAALMALVAGATDLSAQPLGTFRWQLQPYCNVVSVAVTEVGGVYRLEGTDDQCGNGGDKASVVGTAFQNPDGTIGFGLNIVASPGGLPVHVDAALAAGGFDGTWKDSAGNSGAFTFTSGAGTGGSPRPLPVPPVPTAIRLRPDGGFVASGSGGGPIPASGPGARMMWYPSKAAFRAGAATATEWDDANIGRLSAAFGQLTRASGYASFAGGVATTASGDGSTALGIYTTASGRASTAMGNETQALASFSTAMGYQTTASGDLSTALGYKTVASGSTSTALGVATTAAGQSSTTMGTLAATTPEAPGSFVYGDRSTFGAGDAVVTSTLPNQFLVRAAGGTVFWSTAGTTYPTSPGVVLYAGDSAWSSLSDVNAKENFRDLAGDDVLARIAAMPVREWNYKAQDAAIRHIGPTAQDFHAAFGLGPDERRISTVDADGVALAAVKALEARTRALVDENRELRERLTAVEAQVATPKR